MSQPLKLLAQTNKDLQIISATMQDAVVDVADMAYLPKENRFFMLANRYRWEEKQSLLKPRAKRVRTLLQINHVLKAQTSDLDLANKENTLALLAIRTGKNTHGDMIITLTFSGKSAIQLVVEDIDLILTDTDLAWDAIRKPHHHI